MRPLEDLDAEKILKVFNSSNVDYVVIGALAATLQGSPLRTDDIDICPADDFANLDRLAEALNLLEANEWDPRKEVAVGIEFTAETLQLDRLWILVTKYGPLDLVFDPAGSGGYKDLSSSAITIEIDGLQVRVAAIEDIIRTKEATGREKDRRQLPMLRRLQQRLDENH
jgi:predicted nucleotidyltransferase